MDCDCVVCGEGRWKLNGQSGRISWAYIYESAYLPIFAFDHVDPGLSGVHPEHAGRIVPAVGKHEGNGPV